jgi:hypothetical protein
MAVCIIDYEIISENKFSEISNMKPQGSLSCVNDDFGIKSNQRIESKGG